MGQYPDSSARVVINVKLEDRHFDEAIPSNSFRCPIAKCLKEIFVEEARFYVSPTMVVVTEPYPLDIYLPDEVCQFITYFDRWGDKPNFPTEWRLEVPKRLVRPEFASPAY